MSLKQGVQAVFGLAVTVGILFGSAGRLDWVAGWAFFIFYLSTSIYLAVLLKRHDPELLRERREGREGVKKWDRLLVTLYSLVSLPALVIVSGLNVRFGWAPQVGMPIWIAAIVVGLTGSALAFRAFLSNTYFSTYVRIQRDRGHTVVSDGPYRFIRHPGYTGNILFALSIPLFLGSVWALIPAGVAVLVILIRTALEDRTLRDELEGYEAYTRRVRFRLVPGIW